MLEKPTFIKYIASDEEAYYNLVKDDQLMRYITGRGMTIAEAKAKFTQILLINAEHENLGYFKIVDPKSNAQIGECKLVTYTDDHSYFEIGYLLKSNYWKQGLGTLICQEMLTLAAEVDPNKAIVALIDPDNIASRRLLEKFNFNSFFVGTEDGLLTEKLRLQR